MAHAAHIKATDGASAPPPLRPGAAFLRALSLCAAALFAVVPAKADMIDTSGLKPWETCALCHGLDGISRMQKFPRLAGQRPDYIEKQLHDFRAGKRSNDGGQMSAIVTEITEQDIPVVAAHFSGAATPQPIDGELSADAAQRARTLYESGDAAAGIPACIDCHGTTPKGAITGPFLTSQHPDYLAKQLRDFRESNRTNDATQSMPAIAGKLSDTDIVALAGYIAALPRDRM